MFVEKPFLGAVVALAFWSVTALAEPEPIPVAEFEKLQQLIRSSADESRWQGLEWLTSVWEARQKAAAEGKPILLWSGGGAPPLGGC